MKQWDRTQIISGLQKMIPDMNIIQNSEEFDGIPRGCIWTHD